LTLRQGMAVASDGKHAAAFERVADRFMKPGFDLEGFFGTRTEYMLGHWIAGGESWTPHPEERACHEREARSIVSIGGGDPILHDGRPWNGRMRDYWPPRWCMFPKAVLRS